MSRGRDTVKKRTYIILSAIVCTAVMILLDLLVKPPYIVKSFIKIGVFGGGLLSYMLLYKEKLTVFRIEKRQLLKPVLLAVGTYFVILGGYALTKQFIDYSSITGTLTSTIGVSRENFLYVSLYISFVNSLLEELLFRGYCFLTLRKHLGQKRSAVFAALLFAVYHGGVLDGWFNIGIYVLMLALLFIAGMFFNWLDDKTDSVLSSWLPHMFANFGINTVGFLLFGLL